MARKKTTEADVMSDLAKDLGGKLLSEQGPINFFIDTGNLAVNWVCSNRFMGGGLPGGRIIEILGPSSGGKSYWASNAVRGVQFLDGLAAYLDAENAMNAEFAARTSHIDPAQLIHFRPRDNMECLEKVFLKIHNVMRKVRAKYKEKPLFFVLDSISVPPSARELKETGLSENFTEAEWKKVVGKKEQPGERARVCNKEFRKLESILEKNDATLLVVNQIRQKIGQCYGSPETASTAATVLEFYSCLRLRVSAHKRIENKKLKKVIGINLKVKNLKNRINTPYLVAEDIQLFWDKGVNPLSGLLVALEQSERIVKAGKGIYKINEPWAGGKEDATFRATKSKNTVDVETLCAYPALIDAKNEEEIRDYLAIFGDAIAMSDSEDIEEGDLTDDLLGEDGEEEKQDD